MGNAPLVSVIIPAYNAAPYIERAIKSVKAQTWENCEAVIVDDGSTDSTSHILAAFERDENVTLLHQDNGGVSCARNAAMQRASGRYCVFLDADDWLASNAVERLMAIAEVNQNSLVCCGRTLVRESHPFTDDSWGCDEGFALQMVSAREAKFCYGRKTDFNIQSACYKLFSMEVIRENSLAFNSDIANGEDGLFVFQYLDYMDNAIYIPESLWFILQRPGSATRVPYNRKWITALDAIDIMIDCASTDAELTSHLHVAKMKRAAGILRAGISSGLIPASDWSLLRNLFRECGYVDGTAGQPILWRLLFLAYKYLPRSLLKAVLRFRK